LPLHDRGRCGTGDTLKRLQLAYLGAVIGKHLQLLQLPNLWTVYLTARAAG